MATDLFLTNDLSDIDPLSNTEYKAWTARGGAAVSETDTATVTSTPFQDANGDIYWYTPRLEAFAVTTSDVLTANLRMAESAMASDQQARFDVHEVDNAGSVVATIVNDASRGVEMGLTEAAQNFIGGPAANRTFAAGNRLRITVKHGSIGASATGTCTFWWDGPTAGASGDSWVQVPWDLVEYDASDPIHYEGTTKFTAGNGTSISGLAKPAGTAVGDCLLLQVYIENAGETLTPASTGDTWTLIHNTTHATPTPDAHLWSWICIVGNASSTIGVTWGGGSFWRDAAVHRFSGVDQTTPQDVTATENTGTSTTPTATGVASGTANRELVMLEANFAGNARSAWTSPLVEHDDSENVAMASGTDTAGTDTGNKTATITSTNWLAHLVALRPAAGAKAPMFRPRNRYYTRRRVA